MLRLLLTAAILAAFSSVSFAQEANDDCDGAVEILLDELVAYSTVDATSAGPVVTGCGSMMRIAPKIVRPSPACPLAKTSPSTSGSSPA